MTYFKPLPRRLNSVYPDDIDELNPVFLPCLSRFKSLGLHGLLQG
jgi:hypothetical protein